MNEPHDIAAATVKDMVSSFKSFLESCDTDSTTDASCYRWYSLNWRYPTYPRGRHLYASPFLIYLLSLTRRPTAWTGAWSMFFPLSHTLIFTFP